MKRKQGCPLPLQNQPIAATSFALAARANLHHEGKLSNVVGQFGYLFTPDLSSRNPA